MKNSTQLTDAQVRKIKPSEKKVKYPDGKGLYLEVIPADGMHCRMKFQILCKEIFLVLTKGSNDFTRVVMSFWRIRTGFDCPY